MSRRWQLLLIVVLTFVWGVYLAARPGGRGIETSYAAPAGDPTLEVLALTATPLAGSATHTAGELRNAVKELHAYTQTMTAQAMVFRTSTVQAQELETAVYEWLACVEIATETANAAGTLPATLTPSSTPHSTRTEAPTDTQTTTSSAPPSGSPSTPSATPSETAEPTSSLIVPSPSGYAQDTPTPRPLWRAYAPITLVGVR